MTSQRTEGKTAHGIRYSETFSPGSRDTLALVMGYAGSREAWPRDFVESLAKTYRVVTLDNRGTGESLKPEDPKSYFIGDMGADLLEVMDEAGAGEFHLLGYSLGGCIAQDLAGKRPGRVKSLVLMSTTAGGKLYTSPPAHVLESLANPQGETLWDLYLSTWRLCLSPQAIEKHSATLQDIFASSSKYLTPRFAMKGHLHAYRGFDSSSYLGTLAMPVLVVTGDEDRLTPMENSRAIARLIPHAKLLVIPGCEHAPHIEARELLLRELFSFWGRKEASWTGTT